MKLIVLRHATTEANEKGIINGRHDEPLSAVGKRTLPQLVSQLQQERLDAIYASPLKRALETAEPIAADHHAKVIIDHRLIEVNMGSFTGQTFKATQSVFGKSSPELLSTYEYDLRQYGGESAEQVKARVSSFLEDIKEQQFKTVLIVTHGGIVRWFYYLCVNQKVGSLPNGTMHNFEV